MRTRKIYFLVLLCIVLSSGLFAWQQVHGTARIDQAFDALYTSDGSILVVGYGENPGVDWFDAKVMKLSITGELLWEKWLGNEFYQDKAYCLLETPEGYVIGGSGGSFGAIGTDMFLYKLNSSGDSLSARAYGTLSDDFCRTMIKGPENGIIMAGKTFAYGLGDCDFYVVSVNERGDTVWTNHYGTDRNEEVNSIISCYDGGYFLVGTSYTSALYDSNLFVAKITSDGILQWSKDIGGDYEDAGYAACQLPDSSLVFGGMFSEAPGHPDFFLGNLSNEGDSIQYVTWGTPGHDYIHALINDEGSSKMIASGWKMYDGYIAKINSAGDEIWTNEIGGSRDDRFFSVDATTDDGYILSGYSYSEGLGIPDKPNIFIVRTDSLGDPDNDCLPAVIWNECPPVDGSFSSCSEQSVTFGLWDVFGGVIDDDRLNISKILKFEDMTAETTYLAASDDDVEVTYDGDSCFVTITGTYSEGQSVYLVVDSIFTEDLCYTPRTGRNSIRFDFGLPYITEIYPNPGDTLDWEPGIEISVYANMEDDLSGIRIDESMFLTYAVNNFDASNFIDTMFFTTNANISSGIGYGDSIMICAQGSDQVVSGYSCTCESHTVDTCWVFYTEIGVPPFDYTLNAGWNIISNPFMESSYLETTFPTAISFFEYTPESRSYISPERANTGVGYWALMPDEVLATATGVLPADELTLHLVPGWNLIGSLYNPFNAIVFEDHSEVIPPVYGYNPDGYFDASTLLPGEGYWILVSDSVSVTIPGEIAPDPELSSFDFRPEPVDSSRIIVDMIGCTATFQTTVYCNCGMDSITAEFMPDGDRIVLNLTEHTSSPADCNDFYMVNGFITFGGNGRYTFEVNSYPFEGPSPVLIDLTTIEVTDCH